MNFEYERSNFVQPNFERREYRETLTFLIIKLAASLKTISDGKLPGQRISVLKLVQDSTKLFTVTRK